MTKGVHEICDRYALAEFPALDPLAATEAGLAGFDSALPDFSPDGYRELAALRQRTAREVTAAEPADPAEELARAVFLERMEASLRLHDAGLDRVAMVDGPVQRISRAFTLMRAVAEPDWAAIAARLRAVPAALAGVKACLGESRRELPARQVRRLAEECDALVTPQETTGSWFDGLVAQAAGAGHGLLADLRTGAAATTSAYAAFAAFLRDEVLPVASARDAVHADVHGVWSRFLLGAEVDPLAAYEWGWQELHRVEDEVTAVVRRLGLGAGLAETARALDSLDRYRVPDRATLLDWTRQTAVAAVSGLGGTQFDIPPELQVLDSELAAPGTPPGARYTPPAPGRPGCLWWSIPREGSVSLWRKKTTVHHEGVPGHHLQAGMLALGAPHWNAFQRHLCEIPGHHEGWALYAERLMHELGFLDDDGYLLGMLNAQLLRAARLVLDIGLHLELGIPGGGHWTPERGAEFLRTRTGIAQQYVEEEITRYLGWPGQASSYKLGERMWREIRSGSDPAGFHRWALETGPAGLDVLRAMSSRAGTPRARVSRRWAPATDW